MALHAVCATLGSSPPSISRGGPAIHFSTTITARISIVLVILVCLSLLMVREDGRSRLYSSVCPSLGMKLAHVVVHHEVGRASTSTRGWMEMLLLLLLGDEIVVLGIAPTVSMPHPTVIVILRHVACTVSSLRWLRRLLSCCAVHGVERSCELVLLLLRMNRAMKPGQRWSEWMECSKISVTAAMLLLLLLYRCFSFLLFAARLLSQECSEWPRANGAKLLAKAKADCSRVLQYTATSL